MASSAQIQQFLNETVPSWTKYARQYGFSIVSFAIAQSCLESGYGTSYDAVNRNNLLGIGPHMSFSSWDSCIQGYYTKTVLGKSSKAKNAKTLDEYYKAFVESGYLGGSGQSAYYSALKSIIEANNLTKYDNASSGSNKLEEFVQKALSYKGYTAAQWSQTHPNFYHQNAWCADFVSACGQEVEITGKVFEANASAHICAHSVENYGGQFHTESNYNPQRGDLVNFVWGKRSWADHIGIVVEYKNGVVYTIEGNTSNSVASRSYARSSSSLLGFGHPDWSRVGGSSFGISGNLFDELCTRKDAILRESAYLETIYESKNGKKIVEEYKPTVKVTDMKLSLINYTDLFQAFWTVGLPTLNISNGAESDYDYSKLDPKVRIVVQYLVHKGLNNAAACGICGNIKHESSFRTECIGDNGTSFGLCQWNNERGTAMKRMAGSNWSNNITGQLDYLWYELETQYSSLLENLKSVDNTESGCQEAADMFVRQFESPANVDYQSKIRQDSALEYFNQITQIIRSNGSGTWTKTVNYANLSAARKKIIDKAYEIYEAKVPYVWGGESMSGMDCSGFTKVCYAAAGITITHYSGAQRNEAPHTGPVSDASIGDILWRQGHVAIYIGDGKTLEEYSPGKPPAMFTSDQFTLALHWDI